MLILKKYLTNKKLPSILPNQREGGLVSATVCMDYDFEYIRSRSLKVEGTLAWISAYKRRFLATLIAKYLLSLISELQRCLDITKFNDEEVVEILDSFRRVQHLFEKALPMLLVPKLTFLGARDRERFVNFGNYVENMVDALEIRNNKEADAKVRELPQIMDKIAHKLPDWRQCSNLMQ